MRFKIVKSFCIGMIAATLATGSVFYSGSNKLGPVNAEESSNIEGTIVFATNMTNMADTTIKELANEYMEKNPGAEIKIEALKDYDDTLRTRIAGGEAPDIYYRIDSMNSEDAQEFFLPLDDFGWTDEELYNYDVSRSPDGNIYNVSDSIDYLGGIVYNKNAFEVAGIENVPDTIEELYETAQKLKDANIIPMGTAYKEKWTLFPWIDFDLLATIYRGDSSGKVELAESDILIDENTLESANVLRELYRNDFLEPDIYSANWDQLKLDLSQGKMGMYYIPSWLPSQLVELGLEAEKIGMFPFPGSKGIYVTTNKVWGVSSTTEYPELAKDFLKFLIEDGKYATATLVIPSWKGVEVDAPFIEELLSYGVPEVTGGPLDVRNDLFVKIQNESEIDEQAFLQNYIISSDEDGEKLVRETNEKWAAAREKINQ